MAATFTQRLKLSEMRWKHEAAGIVLTLRVILLGGKAAITVSVVNKEINQVAYRSPKGWFTLAGAMQRSQVQTSLSRRPTSTEWPADV
jgi:hypothetical protein